MAFSLGELIRGTTATVKIGPFLDKTDGVTAEAGLAGTMTVEISKANLAFGARNSATAISYDADGWYDVELDTTDLNTGGRLIVKATAAATHLYTWHEFTVKEPNLAPSPVTLYAGLIRQSTAKKIHVGPFIGWSGDNADTVITVTEFTGTLVKGNTASASTLSITASGGDNDMAHVGGGIFSFELSAGNTDTLGELTLYIENSATMTTYKPVVVKATVVSQKFYDGMTGDYLPADVVQWNTSAVATPNTAGVPKVDMTEIGGSSAKQQALAFAIDSTNRTVDANLTRSNGATAPVTSFDNNIAKLDALVSSVATPAQVNAQVVDVLKTDTIAEITGASDAPATPTFEQALRLIYMLIRNDSQSTASARGIRNDAGAEVLSSTMSDNGTTFSQGKLG